MVSVGLAEPALAEEGAEAEEGPPPELMALGPLYESEDCVVGSEDCVRFFPPGYNTPEPQHKPKSKKKKKVQRHNQHLCIQSETHTQKQYVAFQKRTETKEDTLEDAPADATHIDAGEVENGDAGETGDGGDEELADEEETHNDKATSPPPQTPH